MLQLKKRENMKINLFTSQKLNDEALLQKLKNDILSFLEENNITKEDVINIGTIKNGYLIQLLKNEGFNVEERAQHPKSLSNSNKKAIRENQNLLFINYNDSFNMNDLLEYAQTLQDKNLMLLKLNDNQNKGN
jgi:hypothetical protein